MFSVKSRHRRGLTEIDRRTRQFDACKMAARVPQYATQSEIYRNGFAKSLPGALEKIVSCRGLSVNWNLGG